VGVLQSFVTTNYTVDTSNVLSTRLNNVYTKVEDDVLNTNTSNVLSTRINNLTSIIVQEDIILKLDYRKLKVQTFISILDRNYKYISFIYTPGTGDQTFYNDTFSKDVECDILIIGGGGAGGNSIGSSGGAGGVLYTVNKILNMGSYTVGVGNGGVGLVILQMHPMVQDNLVKIVL